LIILNKIFVFLDINVWLNEGLSNFNSVVTWLVHIAIFIIAVIIYSVVQVRPVRAGLVFVRGPSGPDQRLLEQVRRVLDVYIYILVLILIEKVKDKDKYDMLEILLVFDSLRIY
jgi:hypothetical protein